MLRKEYLNQTWNFLPGLKSKYDNQTLNPKYETYQDQILQKGSSSKKGKHFEKYIVLEDLLHLLGFQCILLTFIIFF